MDQEAIDQLTELSAAYCNLRGRKAKTQKHESTLDTLEEIIADLVAKLKENA